VAGKPKRLTPKQEKFAREYFRTGNASEAYRIAYDCQNMKPETINRNAIELTQNSMITARIDELRTRAEKRVIWKKEDAVARLVDIAEQNERDRVAAVRELAKIMGWEAPTRQQITASIMSPYERFIEAMKGNEPEPETEPDSGD